MFSPDRSARLRPCDYERVLRAIASLHRDHPADLRLWSSQPVTAFAGRLISAVSTIVDQTSFASIALMRDMNTRAYWTVAAARICSPEPHPRTGLNTELASLLRNDRGYCHMQDLALAGHAVADVDVMGRRRVKSSPVWREVYSAAGLGYLSLFTLPGQTTPYWIGIFREDSPLRPRELAMLRLLREQILACPQAARQVEMPDRAGAFRKFGLRPSEAEVLRWICEGKRDGEIAVITGKSVRTVNAQVRSVLAALRVETRTAAARLAIEHLRPDADGQP